MLWPRGKYNGKRIGGVTARLTVDVLWWYWRPRISAQFGTLAVHWLCFHLWAEAAYSSEPIPTRRLG